MEDHRILVCKACGYSARVMVFPGEIGIRAVKCDKCKRIGPKMASTTEAIRAWNSEIVK